MPSVTVFLPLTDLAAGHLRSLADASKMSLPNLLPPALWQKSGRWESTGAEVPCRALFLYEDNK